MASPRVATLKLRVRRLRKVQTFEQLAALLRCSVLELLGLVSRPGYRTFRIPKKSGRMRLIEDPMPRLKKVQKRLNDYLQAIYYFYQTEAAYGFVLNPREAVKPRNILSNAQQHLEGAYLLNVDLQDFFHSITEERVVQLFSAPLLAFDQELSKVLASLCCYKGRLPMGAPTSPVISNLVSIPLDHDLLHYGEEQSLVYTRYADDMSFSSVHPITAKHLAHIRQWIEYYGFRINPDKVRWFGPKDGGDREVTGLALRDGKVTLLRDYLPLLDQAIQHLDAVYDAQFGTANGKERKADWVKEFQQQVRGKLEFARQILGSEDREFELLENKYWQALEPPVHYGPLTWLAFGYDGLK